MHCWPAPVVPEATERQPGFMAPNLSPKGLRLLPHELADGVYALMANQLPKDNNGLVVGTRAALVIDAGITPGVGRYLLGVARELTDRPIRYLANTTYHGDHTFGNVAFGDDVAVVSSRLNKAAMTDLEAEKRMRSESMYGDPGMEEVVTWREPDVVFDRFCEIDLGGRVVHLWHFGSGNGSGDTLVHVPDARVAWVGNFLRRAGMPPMLLAGDPIGYTRSIRAMKATLELDRFVPGHGPLSDAEPSVSWMLAYLEDLAAGVDQRLRQGVPLEDLYGAIPLRDPLRLPPETPGADRFPALMQSLHELNILLAYRYLTKIGSSGERLG
ncbi:MBL fold metallo-hydrolase [Pseudonocardia acaciae]|uniref:MBL fold metallo-hydrolase n=1 Tax=Pseudonocardia acaciae TaxID=551276 RepID=UPI00048F1502|nr:MBL fold metallo-hydrolase [Pseudonocardia acaciae]